MRLDFFPIFFRDVQVNVPTTSGAEIAAVDSGGVQHQKIVIEKMDAGVPTPIDSSNPLPVTGVITAASLPLPTLAATSTKQSDGSQKSQVVDGSGNVIGATSNALDVHIKSGNVTLIASDIEIGAVELKNAGTDDRVAVINSAPTTEFGVVTRNIPSGTQPISAASLPLPSGAAISANQQTDALTDAQLRAADVKITLDGEVVPVTGTFFQATQPISAAALPLPSGAATAANQQTNAITDAQIRATPLPVSGTVSVNEPVTVDATDLDIRNLAFATDKADVSGSTGVGVTGTFFQATQPVSAASLPLPSGAATAAIQTDGTQKTQIVDAGGDAVTVTGGKLDVNAAIDTTGLATSANQVTGNGSVASIDTKTPALGQALAAASTPVVLTAAQISTLTPLAAVQANAGTNLNTSALNLEATQADIRTALQIMDDWDETDRAKVNPIAGQAGVAGGTGVDGATVQRVSLATNVALPAGTNAIGKLSANSGVDIGDTDVTSIIPGTGATNLGKAEDALHTTGDVGVMALGVGNEAQTTLAADGDYIPLATDVKGNNMIVGNIAHDGVDAGNSVKIGGKVSTAITTPVADADRVNAWFDENGRQVVSDRDTELGVTTGTTGLRDRIVSQRCTVLADSLADGIAGFWTQTVAGGGVIASTGGEGRLTTSTGTTGSAQMVSTNVAYYPGQVAWMNSAVRFGDTGTVGNIRRIGMFTVSGTTPQEGFYYELTGTTLNAVYVKAGTPTAVASTSWSRFSIAPFTLDTNYHSFEIRYTANTIWFYVDNILRHAVSGTSSALTSSLTLPITLTNVKTSGATDITFAIRNIGNGRFGQNGGVVAETGLSAVEALAVGGGTPHDSVDTGNPLKIGGYAKATAPTAVADGDRANLWLTNNGAVNTVEVVASTIFNGKTTVTTAGTRVVLAASQAVKSVTIKALSVNTGFIYVGNATVASTNGFQLSAGDSVSMDIANLNTVNIDSSVSAEGVTYIGIN